METKEIETHLCDYCKNNYVPEALGPRSKVVDSNSDGTSRFKDACPKENCQLRLQLDLLKIAYDKLKASHDDNVLRATNNAFRILGIPTYTLEGLIKDGKIDLTIFKQDYIARNKPAWHEMSEEAQFVWMEIHQSIALTFSEIIGLSKNKKELKVAISKKILQESALAKQHMDTEIKESEDAKFFRTPKGKAVKAAMTQFKMSRSNAEKMVDAMGAKI